ncbi:MAG: hypothetical protein CO108_05765 [Deltaproteobacteria bacterium CG_4_9_14_3_um_filter_63_12]|nr:MAG: hypothetical protein CO108_05765 [Deltaproteobacteria bacterium CG_4_9_14_3_um_filter_63_12]
MPTEPLRCESKVSRVTVYARGAQIVRTVTLPKALPDGPTELVFDAISPLAEASSFRASVTGSRDVVGLCARLWVPTNGEVPGEALKAVRELRLKVNRLEEQGSELRARKQQLEGVEAQLAVHPQSRRFEADQRFEDALAVIAHLDTQAASLVEALKSNQEAIAAARRELFAAELVVSRARSSELAGSGHPTTQVSLTLSAGDEPLEGLELTYLVDAARWWPAYTVRLDTEAGTGEVSLEAYVAQLTLEDWSGVEVALSTADMNREVALPELPSWRLGRAQAQKEHGYRPPPSDLDGLFQLYDRAMAKTALPQPPTTTAIAAPEPKPDYDEWEPPEQGNLADGEASYQERERGIALEEMAMPMALAFSAQPTPKSSNFLGGLAKAAAMPVVAPMALGADLVARSSRRESRRQAPSGYGGGVPGAHTAADGPVEESWVPADSWLDFDNLEMASSGSQRGKLAARAVPSRNGLNSNWRIDQLAGPRFASDPLNGRGEFDTVYSARGVFDIASDDQLQRIAISSASASTTSRFRCVPIETSEVFREVQVDNPFAWPLLGGPVDVFIGGALITTSQMEPVGRGGQIVFGLGVEERLRVARNARANETSAGLFGGRTEVEHSIDIEISSALGHPAALEILDRMPISDDEELELELTASTPDHEAYEQVDRGKPVRGGLRWLVEVPEGGKRSIRFTYKLTLPSKREVVGGNRRD